MIKTCSFLFLLYGFGCNAQIFSVSSDKNNVLYKGVDNPLTIIVQNVSPANIIAKANYGKLTGKDGRYIYYSDTGSLVKIVLYKKVKNQELLIGLYTLRLKQIPDPEARIAGRTGGNISEAVLKNQSRITCDIETFYFEKGLPIVSFTLSIIRNNSVVKEIENTGEEFNEETRNLLSQIKVGDSLVFKNILAKRHDSTLTILNLLTFSVTTVY